MTPVQRSNALCSKTRGQLTFPVWTTQWGPIYVYAVISHASKVMLRILQARLQQYVNCELPNFQAGFRKGSGTRDQIANTHWIIGKAREFQKNIYFCFTNYAKAFDCGSQQTVENSKRDGNTRPPDLPPEKSVCRSRSNR